MKEKPIFQPSFGNQPEQLIRRNDILEAGEGFIRDQKSPIKGFNAGALGFSLYQILQI